MFGKSRNDASSSSNNNKSSSRGESVVVDVGRRRSSCGYCRSTARTSLTYGLWANSMTVDDYQDLLDRGWRRSGSFLYKPEMEKTCCPAYTIRLRAADFVASKEQTRVSRRMQRFLNGTLDAKKPDLLMDESSNSCSTANESLAGSSEENSEDEQYIQYLSDQIDNAVRACTESGVFPSDINLPKASIKKVTHAKKKLIRGSGDLMYTSNISFQIAASIKRTANSDIHKLGVSENCADQNGQYSEVSPNIIAEKLLCSLNQVGRVSDFSTTACNGHLNFYSLRSQSVSGDRIGTKKPPGDSPRAIAGKYSSLETITKCPQKRRKLEIHLKRSSFDPEEYALYRRYQIRVHNDEPDKVTESSYRRFLVDTPLVFVPPSGNSTVPPCGFGSFHQQYVVDGQLVAVGVVDILPKCLSSKYLFWDPDFAFLSLGKYSALQEISWVKENEALCPSLQYYYLGYYIHSCRKMRYKAAYHPSELLCPLRYQWISYDIAKPLLDRKPYVILSDFEKLQNEQSSQHQLLENTTQPQYRGGGEEIPTENLSHEDVEMVEPDFEGSDDDDSDTESTGSASANEVQDGDLGNVLIGLKNFRLRYKDHKRTTSSSEQDFLETQLHRYTRVVGAELSERMVYFLG